MSRREWERKELSVRGPRSGRVVRRGGPEAEGEEGRSGRERGTETVGTLGGSGRGCRPTVVGGSGVSRWGQWGVWGSRTGRGFGRKWSEGVGPEGSRSEGVGSEKLIGTCPPGPPTVSSPSSGTPIVTPGVRGSIGGSRGGVLGTESLVDSPTKEGFVGSRGGGRGGPGGSCRERGVFPRTRRSETGVHGVTGDPAGGTGPPESC